jgi:hypothetical protein
MLQRKTWTVKVKNAAGKEYLRKIPTENVKLEREVVPIMRIIASNANKVNKEQHLKLLEKWELGPFKKWELDINRLREIEKGVKERSKQMMATRPAYDRKAFNCGKKQKAKALQKLKDEIDNI